MAGIQWLFNELLLGSFFVSPYDAKSGYFSYWEAMKLQMIEIR
jgi:hypothetical protein